MLARDVTIGLIDTPSSYTRTANGTDIVYTLNTDSAQIGDLQIDTDLGAGNSVTIDTTGGGSQLGDIVLDSVVFFGNGTNSLNLIAEGSVSIQNSAALSNLIIDIQAPTAYNQDNTSILSIVNGSVVTDSVAIAGGGGTTVAGTGTFSIRPSTASTSIGLGTGVGDLSLDGSELAAIDGFTSLTIGDTANSGAVTIGNATFLDNVIVRGGSIDVTDTVTSNNAISLVTNDTAGTGQDINIDIPSGMLTATGGNILLDAGDNITVTALTTVTGLGVSLAVDGVDADAGVGSTVTIDGVINTTTTPPTITGGADTDTILVTGNSVTFTATGAASGDIAADTNGYSYTAIENVSAISGVSTANLNFAGAETLTVSEPSVGVVQFASSLGPTFTVAPTVSLTLDPGTGADTVNILASDLTVASAIILDNDVLPNTVNVSGNLTNTGDIEITATNINVNASISAGGSAVLGESGNAAASVVLNDSVLATTLAQFDSPVQVATDTSITVSSGLLDFSTTLDGPARLAVSASSDVQFSSTVGASTPLTSLVASSGSTTRVFGNVVTTGALNFNDPVAVAGTPDLAITSSNGLVTFGSTIEDSIADQTNLTINSVGATTLNGDVGTTNRLASLTVNSGGPFTAGTTLNVLNDLSLNVSDNAAATDSLTVSGTLTSAAGNVSLTAGDSVDVQATATISAGSNIDISVDPIAGDLDPEGGTVALANFIATGTLGITGGDDADTFTVVDLGFDYSVDGGDPTSSLGDRLIVDGGGSPVGISQTLAEFSSNLNLNYTSIEDISVVNSNVVTISGSAGDDTFTVSQVPASTENTIVLDSGQVVTVDRAVSGLTINGGNANDSLIYDITNGIPDFIVFSGGLSVSPLDQVIIQGSNAVDTLTFSYVTENDGSVSIDGSTVVDYNGIAPLTSTITATNVILDYSSDSESIDVTQLGNDITVDSTVGEITTFAAPTGNLTISTGGGIDTVTIDGLNVDLTGEFFIDDAAPADDTVIFSGSPSTITTGNLNVPTPQVQVNANLTVDGNIRLGAASGTGQVQTGATISSAGDIVFDEPVMLNDTTTVITDADSMVTFHNSVNGGNDLTVTGGTGVDFLAENGLLIPPTSLTVTATNGSIRTDDFFTTLDQTYNSPVLTGSGGGTVDLISSAGTITFASSIDNGSVPADSLNTSSDGETSFNGAIGNIDPLDSLTTRASGDITLSNNVNVLNAIDISTSDSGNDNLLILSPASLATGATGTITFNILDDVTIESGASITTSDLTIQVDDPITGDDLGIGSTVSIAGTLTVDNLASVTGGDDADAISVAAQSGSSFDITGGAPLTSPGDSLAIDGNGQDVTIDALGMLTVVGAAPVNFNGIEDLSLSDVNTLTIVGDINPDSLTLVADPNVIGGDLLSFNGLANVALSTIGSIVFNGGDGNDLVTVDSINGLPTTPLTFNGEGQDAIGIGDSLVVSGTFTTQTFNYVAPSVDGNDGTVDLDGTVVTYTGLEPITGGDSADTILNFNTGLANNATLQNSLVAGQIEIIDNGATFEDTVFPNPTNSLTINLGDQGDVLQVNALDAAYAASMIVNGGAGVDDVQFDSVTISNTPGRGLDISSVDTVSITSSNFSGNTADNGAGVRLSGSSTTITNTTFTNNTAQSGGALEAGGGTTTIDSSTFSNNIATGDTSSDGGGAIRVEGVVIIQNNTMITGNAANGLAGSGGGIFVGLNGTLTVSDSQISTNTANRAGGGIEHQANSTLTLTNVTLDGNNAGVAPAVAAPGNGGGLHVTGFGNVDVLGGAISNNSAAAEGGGLWNDLGIMTINSGAQIFQNVAAGDLDPVGVNADLQGGGGIFNNGGTLTINDLNGAVLIQNNQASGTNRGSGGGIMSIGGNVSLTGATVQLNEAARAGGGIEIIEGIVTITTSTLRLNDVSSDGLLPASPGNGGALHITGAADVTIDLTTIDQNTAEAEGGGLWNSATGTLTINDLTTIDANVARGNADPSGNPADVQGGGGVFNNGGTLSITGLGASNTLLQNNVATGATFGSGGGLLSVGGNVTLNTVTVSGNEAVRAGGGIELVDGTVMILSSSITGNDASDADLRGLGLAASPGNGGGLHVTGTADVTLNGTRVSSNVAQQEGGGLWNSTGTMTLENGTSVDFNVASGPTADDGGGGVFNNGGTLVITDALTTISSNTADGTSGSGGGIFNNAGGTVTITDASVDSNIANRAGGGIEDASGAGFGVTLDNVFLTNNTAGSPIAAPGNGGGLHITGDSTVTINSSQIQNNTAAAEGGGLWNSSTGTLNVNAGTTVDGNVAQGDVDPTGAPSGVQGGGGIFNDGGTLNIFGDADNPDTFITNNDATGVTFGSGGGLLSIGGVVNIQNVGFTNNTAVRAGGGIELVDGTVDIQSSDLSNNDAGINGGGLHVTGSADVTLNNTDVNLNTAGREGGGLWNSLGTMTLENGVIVSGNTASGPAADDGGGGVFNNGGTLVITGATTTITGNTADGASGSGGGIFNNIGGTLSITDAMISSNAANRAGGGIEDASGAGFGVTFIGGTLSNNNAGVAPAAAAPGNGGGLHVTGDSDVVIDGTAVLFNSAALEGGGLWNGTGTMTIQNGATIDGNTAAGDALDDGGGGIFNNGGSLVITGATTTIQNNRATGLTGAGGGIHSASGGSVSVTGATINNNTASIDGGGLFAEGDSGNVSITQATFTSNTAGDSGGGVFVDGPTFTASQSTFTLNQAQGAGGTDGDGGGIFLSSRATSGNFNITDNSFVQNTAFGSGGGISLIDASGSISGGQLTGNFVNGNGVTFDSGGGGISLVGNLRIIDVSIANVVIDGNTAPAAGGIAIVDARTTISDSTIQNNVATETLSGGGGIGALANVIIGGDLLTITASTLSTNQTAGEGGGIGVINGDVSITDTTIAGNNATGGRGGGIGLLNNGMAGAAVIRSTTIFNNAASDSGGGIAAQNMGIDLLNVTVSGNNSGAAGGGIAYDNTVDAIAKSIAFSTITSNVAAAGGSNLSSTGSPIDVTGTIFNDGVIAAVAGSLNSLGNNLDSGNTGGLTGPGDLVNTDPLLGPLQDNGGPVFTHALLSGSPAIDTGPANGPATDARGIVRPIDGDANGTLLFDIGAFEGEQGTTFLVDNVTDIDDGDVSPGNVSLREAIRLSNTTPGADTITFDPNLAATIQIDSLLGGFSITDPVSIEGPGANLLTIDGQDAVRVFDISASDITTISGITIANGLATGVALEGFGGGISLAAGTLVLDSVHFLDNRADIGGGGLVAMTGTTVTILSSTFSGNVSVAGGAIQNEGDMTIVGSTVSGNTAIPGVDVNAVAIAGVGGGILNAGTLNVFHSTITNNEAQPDPNTSDPAIGGGVAILSAVNPVVTNFVSSIISGNNPTDIDVDTGATAPTSNGFNVVGTGNVLGSFASTGDQTGVTAAGLAPLTDNGGPTPTHALQAGSPAIDAGDPLFDSATFTPPLTFDQRGTGFDRVLDATNLGTPRIDIGSFEVATVTFNSVIQGTKFNDLNSDGDDEAGTDPRLSGISIIVSGDSNVDGQLDTRVAVTDLNGVYQASGLPAGDYVVTEAPLTVTGFNITGNNTPVTVDELATFDGVTDTIGGGQLDISERVHVIDESQQWIEVGFDAVTGGLAANVDANWFANFTIDTDKSFSITESFLYFRNGDTPLLLSTFGSQTHPFDPAVGDINVNTDTRGPATSQTLGVFSNPFSGLLNTNGVDPNQVTGVTFLYRLVLQDTPRTATTTVPVNVTLAADQIATDAPNSVGAINEVVITDLLIGNAVPAPTLTVDDVTFNEADGTGSVSVTLNAAVTGGFSVDVLLVDGTATNPADYAPNLPTTLTFVGTAGEIQTYSFQINEDTIVEGLETFTFTMANPTATAVDVTDTAVVSIADNDSATLTIADLTVNEGDGTATVTVSVDNAVVGGFTVDHSTIDGTALAATDYASSIGTLTFIGTAAETQTFTVPITDDLIVEAIETFTVALSNPSNLNVLTTNTGLVSISDNDTAILQVQDVTVNENAGTATLTVSVNNAVDGGFTVDFATADVSATQPADYSTATGTLTFVGNAAETQTFTVTIIDDLVNEGDETFSVLLSNASNASVITADTAVVTIADDDGIVGTLTVSDPQVSEVSPTGQFVTVTLDNAVPGGFTVDFAAVDGTATQPDDFILNSGTLTFAGTAGESQTVPFSLRIDNNTEGPEQFTVALSNVQSLGATPATAISVSDIGTVTILDGQTNTDVSTTITADRDSATIGETVTYTVTVSNTGDLATLVTSNTLFPPELSILTATGTTGNAVIIGNRVNAGTQTLASGSSFTVVVTATAQTAGNAIVTTSVTTTANDFVPGNNSSGVTTPITAAQTSSIRGSVYNDANNNGIRESGEAGLPNVLISLSGSETRSVLTDANGDYEFANLLAGTYTVTETQPIGFDDGIDTLGTGATATLADDAFINLVLGAGVNATDFNFGERVPVVTVLSGEVYCDNDNDNVHDRPDETVVGTLVFIDDNDNGQLDSGERSTITDSSGNYSFDSVSGSINVNVVVPISCNTITDEPGVRRTIVPVGDLARSIAAVNIDPANDDDVDLVVVSDLSGTLTVVENTPSGFIRGEEFLVGERPQSVFVHQSSLFETPMIAVASIGTPASGGAVFTTNGIDSPDQHGASSGPIDVLVGDFNGDQVLDVLSASFRESLLQLRLGGSSEVLSVESQAQQILSIASGNLFGNFDSSPEVVVSGFGYGSGGQNQLEVYEMGSTGTASLAASLTVSNEIVEVAVENIISSGSFDVIDEIATLQSSGSITVYSVASNGSIESPVTTSVTPGASAFDFGDFNKDGITDVAVANLGSQLIELYAGDGQGRFALVTTVRNVSAPSDVVVADINADGFDDIAVANFYTDINIDDPNLAPQFMLESTVTILQLEIASRNVSVTANATEDFRFPTANTDILLDTTGDNRVTALDALRVINVLGTNQLAEGEQVNRRAATDVNGDGATSAVDALMIINYLSRKSAAEGSQVAIDSLLSDDDDETAREDAIDYLMIRGLF